LDCRRRLRTAPGTSTTRRGTRCPSCRGPPPPGCGARDAGAESSPESLGPPPQQLAVVRIDVPGEGIVVGVRVDVGDRADESAARGGADHLVRRRAREGQDPKEFLGGGRASTEQELAAELAHAEGPAGLAPRAEHRARSVIGPPTRLSPPLP